MFKIFRSKEEAPKPIIVGELGPETIVIDERQRDLSKLQTAMRYLADLEPGDIGRLSKHKVFRFSDLESELAGLGLAYLRSAAWVADPEGERETMRAIYDAVHEVAFDPGKSLRALFASRHAR